MYSRLVVPEEIYIDLGTQFVSNCMQEISGLLSIKRLTATLYHFICYRLVERINSTFMKTLWSPCSQQPQPCYRLVNLLWQTDDDVPQEANGFLPFELLYGRTV